MAYTYTNFKNALRGIFGQGQTNSSVDSGGNVKDHVARLSQKMFQKSIPTRLLASTDAGVANVGFAQTASKSKTQPMLETAVATMEEECDLKSIRIQWDRAPTTSASDYFTFIFLKRKSATFSVTEQVATCAGTTANLGAAPVIHSSKAATLATTASVLDFDPGDILSVRVSKTLLGQSTPPCTITAVFEEK